MFVFALFEQLECDLDTDTESVNRSVFAVVRIWRAPAAIYMHNDYCLMFAPSYSVLQFFWYLPFFCLSIGFAALCRWFLSSAAMPLVSCFQGNCSKSNQQFSIVQMHRFKIKINFYPKAILLIIECPYTVCYTLLSKPVTPTKVQLFQLFRSLCVYCVTSTSRLFLFLAKNLCWADELCVWWA